MLYNTILYDTALYYTIRYDTMLCYTILYYTILYYTILYYTILYYTILYRKAMDGLCKFDAAAYPAQAIVNIQSSAIKLQGDCRVRNYNQ